MLSKRSRRQVSLRESEETCKKSIEIYCFFPRIDNQLSQYSLLNNQASPHWFDLSCYSIMSAFISWVYFWALYSIYMMYWFMLIVQMLYRFIINLNISRTFTSFCFIRTNLAILDYPQTLTHEFKIIFCVCYEQMIWGF